MDTDLFKLRFYCFFKCHSVILTAATWTSSPNAINIHVSTLDRLAALISQSLQSCSHLGDWTDNFSLGHALYPHLSDCTSTLPKETLNLTTCQNSYASEHPIRSSTTSPTSFTQPPTTKFLFCLTLCLITQTHPLSYPFCFLPNFYLSAL